MFTLLSAELPPEEEEEDMHLSLPITKFKLSEVKSSILTDFNPKKAVGDNLFTGRVLQELTKKKI